jgi:hypothetical protein
MDLRYRQGDVPGLNTNSAPTTDAVPDHDTVTPTRGGKLIDGDLKFLPQQIRTIVKAAFQKFYTDIQPQLFGGAFNIEGQDGACNDVWFFIYQCLSPDGSRSGLPGIANWIKRFKNQRPPAEVAPAPSRDHPHVPSSAGGH